ncbi:MAG: carbamoyltransferase HypF [Candidatus Zixiibacteriota bacterium]
MARRSGRDFVKSHADHSAKVRERHRIRVNGIVQGVGFRPFVYRLATELQLSGFVGNNSEGVVIEVEGGSDSIHQFLIRLRTELPGVASITSCNTETIRVLGDTAFAIQASHHGHDATTFISPDIATCDDCLAEFTNPRDRRYRYPFINCTNCGPRYTIVSGIPYDRPNTSMRIFPMCPECQKEYDDPSNRRFHAQPNACPKCGPKLQLRGNAESVDSSDPILSAIELLKQGRVVALRGIGGFHLAVDARNESAVLELRRRKGRAEKPFALMARDVSAIERHCSVSAEEKTVLQDRRRPIVLLQRSQSCDLPQAIAPGQTTLGFMLPYTPLHNAMLAGSLDVLVMTSGNLSEEPIATGNAEALDRLSDLADLFLLHDREILQRCDDSIVKIMDSKPRLVRRSRGYVPEPLFLRRNSAQSGLAVGGELKNCIGLSRANAVFLSQHIGDLDNLTAFRFFESSIVHFKKLLEIEPEFIAHDLHPEYLSTKWALDQQAIRTLGIQHHHAHLASVLAENGVDEPSIGIILDGTGYGTDGTIWGGEILVGNAVAFERVAWLATTPMPGGEAAIKEPWRMALSYLRDTLGEESRNLNLPLFKAIPAASIATAEAMIARNVNSPVTSSCGRLFDGVASILGIKQTVTFEAQAAMELEAISRRPSHEDIYSELLPMEVSMGAIDFKPLIRQIVADFTNGSSAADIGARFHATLAEMFVSQARLIRRYSGINRAALSGGVYQNQLFFEYIVRRLRDEGFEVLTHRQVPTNDGGLAFGQLAVAHAQLLAEREL